MICLQDEDSEAYQRQFGKYIKLGITADGMEALYKKVHSAIRADPAHKPAPKKEVKTKRYVSVFCLPLNDNSIIIGSTCILDNYIHRLGNYC